MKGALAGLLVACVLLGASTASHAEDRPRPMSFDSWLFWWHSNRDEFVMAEPAEIPPEVVDRIASALTTVALERELHPYIRSGAIIALARCPGALRHLETMMEIVGPTGDRESNQILLESATLGIGISGSREARARSFLGGLLDDEELRVRARCFAAASLALLPDAAPEAFPRYERLLSSGSTPRDLAVLSLFSIGVLGDHTRTSQLLGWLENGRIGERNLDDLARAHLVSALGKLRDPRALLAVSGALRSPDRLTRSSAAIATGLLLSSPEARAWAGHLRVLVARSKEDPDPSVRCFSLVALGRVGASPDALREARDICEATLRAACGKAGESSERSFAALGLGLLARADASRAEGVADLLRGCLGPDPSSKDFRAAVAIALGLTGDDRPETVAVLRRLLSNPTEEGRRTSGSAALALGLVGAESARDAVFDALRYRKDRNFTRDVVLAASLLDDARVGGLLRVKIGDRRASQFVVGSCALAAGEARVPGALEPLLRILEPSAVDGRYPDLTRALAAVAIGQIVDSRAVRVLSRIRRDVNYRATVAALEELLTVL